jgi:hypothetical protein
MEKADRPCPNDNFNWRASSSTFTVDGLSSVAEVRDSKRHRQSLNGRL